jgi:hypothetical protein
MLNESKARKVANKLLAALEVYYPFIPTTEIDNALLAAGLNELEPAIYCSEEGRSHEQVGANTWLSLTWYKMPSGRYEIVAYVS